MRHPAKRCEGTILSPPMLRDSSMRVGLALAGWLSTYATVAMARPAQGPEPAGVGQGPPPASAPTPSPCVDTRGSLSGVACELEAALKRQPGALVAIAPIQAGAELQQGTPLATRLVKVVAGRLGAKSHDQPVTLAHARSLASTSSKLVYLQPELKDGELRVVADSYPVVKNFWDRVRDPTPNPTAHAYASRRVDAELRTFLPTPKLVIGRLHRVPSPEREVVALACDDLQGQGRLELAVVGRHSVHLGHIAQRKFKARVSTTWKKLTPVAPRPLREAVGGVAVTPGKHIEVGVTDRARGQRLGLSLERLEQLREPVPWAPFGCTKREGLGLRGSPGPCAAGPPAAGGMGAVDALAGAELIDAAGQSVVVRAGRRANSTRVELWDDRGHRIVVGGRGAQLAVGDLDRDGDPELLSGSPTLTASADAIVVHTWRVAQQKVEERVRMAAPGGVKALAVCPPTSLGRAWIAAAVGREIWVFE